MYSIVYGNEWEDILYFADVTCAYKRLLELSVGKDTNCSFYPVMRQYININGQYKQHAEYIVVYEILQNLLNTHTIDEIVNNQEMIMDVVTVFHSILG